MFGFQRFTSNVKYAITIFILLLFITANYMTFYGEIHKKTMFGVWFILVHLIIVLSVNFLLNHVVVVYWNGKLETITKEMFLEAVNNEYIPYILSNSEDLDNFMRKYIILSKPELKLVKRKIEKLKWERSVNNIDMYDI